LSAALISPYVITRVGFTRARQLMLAGNKFGASEALSYGLVHQTCADDVLDSHVEAVVKDVLKGSPNALAETKKLLFEVIEKPFAESLNYRAELITTLRESEEGQAGMLAFVQKQPPPWVS